MPVKSISIAPSLQGDRDLDADRPVQLDPVIVKKIDKAIGALGDARSARLVISFRPPQQLLDDHRQLIVAISLGEFRDAADADRAGGDLRVQIADHRIRDADVAAQQRQQCFVQHSGIAQLERRDAQPFLKDLGRVGRHRAGGHAADILMVRHRGAQRDHPAVMKTGMMTAISGRCVPPA